MMKPERLQVFLTPSWLIPKLGERSGNEKLAPGGVGTQRFRTHFCNVREGSKPCERAALLQPHLWPISWVMVIPRSKPVSSVITQLHSLLQAPPSRATPLTWLFPSGNTRSYLWEKDPKHLAEHIFLGDFPAMHHLYFWGMGSYHTLWCTREDQHVGGLNHSRGLSSCPTHTHWWGKTWCWSTAGSPAEVPKKALLQHYQCQQVFQRHDWQPFSLWRHAFCSYLWLWQDDHADQVYPHVAAQAVVSQQLWGLCAEDQHKDFNGKKIRTICDEKEDLERADFNTLFGIADRFTLLITTEAVNH